MQGILTRLSVLSFLALGACSSGSSGDASSSASSRAVAVSASPTTSPTTTTPTTTTPTTTTPTTTTLATLPDAALVLRGDGLGPVNLGDDAEQSIAALTAILGAPPTDSGWFDEQIGCDIGVQIRDVQWHGLLVEFSSGPTSLGPAGKEHVLSYFHTSETEGGPPLRLRTDRGIMLGATTSELRAAYPDVAFLTSEIEGPVFDVPGGVSGAMSALGDSGTVQSIRAGLICID